MNQYLLKNRCHPERSEGSRFYDLHYRRDRSVTRSRISFFSSERRDSSPSAQNDEGTRLKPFALFLAFFVVGLVGCQNDEITVTRVPKETVAAAPMPDMGAMSGSMMPDSAPASAPKEIGWKVPHGWTEQAPSAMRVGSFLVKGSNGQTADVSVVPLSGEAGGDAANVNRWRGQINLPPLADEDLAQNSRKISPAGRSMLYVDFVSRDNLIDNKFKKRIIATIYTKGERTWFFKMIGEDATVRSAQPAFMEFLKNLRFTSHE